MRAVSLTKALGVVFGFALVMGTWGPAVAQRCGSGPEGCSGVQARTSARVAQGEPHRRLVRRTRSKTPSAMAAQASAVPGRPAPLPPRPDIKVEEQDVAAIPGIPDARFWADSETAYEAAIGRLGGSWLALSAGGEDSAFGAGLLSGLAQSGRRPEYTVVTGVSSGALLAPFVFLGPKHDAELREQITAINAAEVFEDRRTAESLLDTWPLRAFISKRITPELLAEIAAEHRRGRRLIVVTTNIDAARPVAWNMGAIAAAGTEASLKLFRDVLVASSAIPGLFPPVMIESEANGKAIPEMHVDGGLAATIYVAPDSMLLASSAKPLPMAQLTVIVNGKLASEFAVTDRTLVGVLGRSLSIGVKRSSRAASTLTSAAAKRSGTEFNLAFVEQNFDYPSRGLFDAAYMKALFELALQRGKSANPFVNGLPENGTLPPSAQAPSSEPTGSSR